MKKAPSTTTKATAPSAPDNAHFIGKLLDSVNDNASRLIDSAVGGDFQRLLNLLAAGALAGQYVTYHFAELARQDQYRPWFEQICPELGCTLPSKVDIELIKSSNLVVRSHPQFPDALVVDAILYNRASFTQPFPLLELRFADIQGQLLASRRFKPGEYLAGELAGRSEMPPQVPIRVSLEILDPGTQAVNYSLSFHSPE